MNVLQILRLQIKKYKALGEMTRYQVCMQISGVICIQQKYVKCQTVPWVDGWVRARLAGALSSTTELYAVTVAKLKMYKRK